MGNGKDEACKLFHSHTIKKSKKNKLKQQITKKQNIFKTDFGFKMLSNLGLCQTLGYVKPWAMSNLSKRC